VPAGHDLRPKQGAHRIRRFGGAGAAPEPEFTARAIILDGAAAAVRLAANYTRKRLRNPVRETE